MYFWKGKSKAEPTEVAASLGETSNPTPPPPPEDAGPVKFSYGLRDPVYEDADPTLEYVHSTQPSVV